ncbi:hypothetical protein DYB38_004290 [Aphanomyces astaci]|uniref:Rap-GAP domain-containing protein n=1 Tax=Aphanomyces astaci TaxID=112090 RepID=A0A397E1C4_APHAT|nr:hypothetical protein DYB38_004290 [Aphanomyces astaci]
MFLTWVSKCELLQAPPEAHILKGFNEGCQRGICSMVVGFLSNTSEQQSSTEVAASPLPPSMSVRGTQLTAATWDHLLRLLLGITDCVLHGSKHTLALSLCAHLFRVTLEQFILSLHVTGVKGELWNMLLKFCRRWLHRKAVIEQWHKASLALTQHLMERLHAPPPSSSDHATPPPPSVSIKWVDNAHVTCFELASPLLAYAWYRVMRVIGHPSLFVDPDVYLAAIVRCLRCCAPQVLSLAKPASTPAPPKPPQLPDVNTILRILGPWLFDASLNRTAAPRFALCRAEAIRCLGGLLCRHGIGRTKQVSWPFTIRALMAIQKALLDTDEVREFMCSLTVTKTAVAPSRKDSLVDKRSSMASDLDSSAAVPAAVGGVAVTVLRRACIEACSSLLTIHSHYPVRTITTTFHDSRWKPAVIFTALECLRYLTIVSEHLFKHVFSSCVFLISCVCEFMAANAQVLRATRSPPPYLDQLIASATSCLLEWVVTTPQLLSKAQVMVKVIATTVDAADVHVDFPATTPHADHATRQSAQHLLEYLVKHHAHGNVDGAKQTYDPAAVHYTWNLHTVLSILETTDYVQLTLRDSSGCYQWRTQPQYVPSKLATLASAPPSPPPAQSHPSQHAPTPTSTPVSPLEANPDPLLRSLRKNAASLTSWSTEGWEGNSGGKHATDASAMRHEAQVTLFQSLLQSQSNDFVQHRRVATVNLLEPPPPAQSTTHIARRLLSQLGFLSVASWGSLLPLLPSSGQLIKDLQALDRLPTRETYEIGIAYVVNQPSRAGYDVVNLVTTSTCSDAYLGFLATMGSAVDAHSYGGFLGYLDRNLPVSQALVYAQHNYEVAYYVPTLGHASVLDKAEVLIVWNECQQNYRPGTALWASAYNLPRPKACVTIVIDPLDDGLFCVRICVDGSAFDLSNGDATRAADDTFSGRVLGPLQDGMVVGSEWLGPLIRQTALNAVHVHRLHLRYKHSLGLSSQSPIRPQEKRTKLIAAIAKQYMDPMLPGDFYSALFVPDKGAVHED